MYRLFLKLSLAFLFIIIGFAGRRSNILREDLIRRITWVTTNILFPCLLFHTVYTSLEIDLLSGSIILFFLAIAVSAISYLFGHLFASFFKLHEEMRRVFLILSFKPASGLIGLPLCVILFGEKSLLFAGPYALGIGLIFYTLGLGLLKRGNFNWRVFFNPISVTVCISIILTLLRVHVPLAILSPVRFIGRFAVPLALTVVGGILGMLNFKRGMIDRKVLIVAFNKLILVPVLMLVICIFLPFDPMAKRVAVLMAATPSSLTLSMWALRFGADYIWASSSALFIGIASIITISLFFWISFIIF